MRIYDISLPINPALVVWQGDPPVGMFHVSHLSKGDMATVTRLEMGVHTGTHLDAPCHFIAGGAGVEALDLEVLIGPALLVDVGDAAGITADVLEALAIPPGTNRILIRTSNTKRQLLQSPGFHEDFVAVEADGAKWLVENGVRLVGVDYLSVAPFHDLVSTHRVLLGAGVIPIEGLDLRDVPAGDYQFIGLPLKFVGSDGSPIRAILMSE